MDKERLIRKVAELYYIHDISQRNISAKLGFSRVKINRLLKEAKRRKIIQFNIVSNVQEKRISELENLLETKYKLKEAIIYYDSDIKDPSDDVIFKEVGLAAADYIERILDGNLNIAVTWGKTLFHAIENIKIEKKYPNIKLFSTLGGVSLTRSEYQNNNLTNLLAGKLGCFSYPIYLPLISNEPLNKDIIEKEKSIYEILGSTSKIDYLLTGVGLMSPESKLFTYTRFESDFIKMIRNKEIIGEICWNFFNSDGAFVKTGMENYFVNIPVPELKKIKSKVAVAFGKEKIEVLKAFLTTNIADIFITDSITAESLV
jgi:deoxyribonucleoside regulator